MRVFKSNKNLFPKGTIFVKGPDESVSYGPLYEATISISADHTIRILAHQEDIEQNPEWFKQVEG